jgi:mono/diheme cytochrome c family protein
MQKEENDLEGKEQIQRGQVLVLKGGCNNCHSPKIFTPEAILPDHTRLLSGHPQDIELPKIPSNLIGPDKWLGLFTRDQTAWAGPWGVVFAANLTPDPRTGIGNWTEDEFIKTMRTGKHKDFGRDILPPMAWEDYAELSDEDLRAIFAYLKTLKPVKNAVPAPIPLSDNEIPINP